MLHLPRPRLREDSSMAGSIRNIAPLTVRTISGKLKKVSVKKAPAKPCMSGSRSIPNVPSSAFCNIPLGPKAATTTKPATYVGITRGNTDRTTQARMKGMSVRVVSHANGTARMVDAIVTETTKTTVRARIAATRWRNRSSNTSLSSVANVRIAR